MKSTSSCLSVKGIKIQVKSGKGLWKSSQCTKPDFKQRKPVLAQVHCGSEP